MLFELFHEFFGELAIPVMHDNRRFVIPIQRLIQESFRLFHHPGRIRMFCRFRDDRFPGGQPRSERVDPRRSGPFDFCVELEHIEQGTGRLQGSTATTETSSLKSAFKPRDVLFWKLRAYLRKYWIADTGGVCSTEIWVLSSRAEQVTSEYLFQIVTVDRFIEAASTAYGTHMPRSDWNVVKNYEVRLPPPPEQTAIAAILSDMDAEIAALESKPEKAHLIKQGMMQELLTGRILLIDKQSKAVSDDENTNTVSQASGRSKPFRGADKVGV